VSFCNMQHVAVFFITTSQINLQYMSMPGAGQAVFVRKHTRSNTMSAERRVGESGSERERRDGGRDGGRG